MENVKKVGYGWTKTKPMKIKGELLASTPTARKFKREKNTLRETQLQKAKKDPSSRKPSSKNVDKSNKNEKPKKKVLISTSEEDFSSKSHPQFKRLSYLARATENVKSQSTLGKNPPMHSHEESDLTSQENTSMDLYTESSDQTSQPKRISKKIVETKHKVKKLGYGFKKPTGRAARAVPSTSHASTNLKKPKLPFRIAFKSRSKNRRYFKEVATTPTEASAEDEDMDVGGDVDNGITIDGLFTPVVIQSDEVNNNPFLSHELNCI